MRIELLSNRQTEVNKQTEKTELCQTFPLTFFLCHFLKAVRKKYMLISIFITKLFVYEHLFVCETVVVIFKRLSLMA